MDRELSNKIMLLYEEAWADIEFQNMMNKYKASGQSFLEVMRDLTQEQQNLIYDYMGLLIEIKDWLLEYAIHCTNS